jgi:uncharacterized membrane protein YheB (UPF0754 family)
MTKQMTVELLQQQLPGFYSVDQVIKMINDIEDDSQAQAYNESQIESLIDLITAKVEHVIDRMDAGDLVDYDSAQFDLNGNEISVVDIDTNTSTLVDEINDVISDAVNDFFSVKETQTA